MRPPIDLRLRSTPICSIGVGAFAQPRGVGDAHRQIADDRLRLDRVAGGSRNRRHDGALVTEQPVQQARLAGIRAPGENDGDAVAQRAADVARVVEFAELSGERFEPCGNIRLPRQLFIREVEVRFAFGPERVEFVIGRFEPAGKDAVELFFGNSERQVAPGGNHVVDRFGLGEVELAVHEGAEGEFPRLRRTGSPPRRRSAAPGRPPTGRRGSGVRPRRRRCSWPGPA